MSGNVGFQYEIPCSEIYAGRCWQLENGGGFESTCPGSLDSQTTHLFDNTHAAGRVVASDRFEDILKKRKEVEQRLQSMVTQYESEMKSLKAQLKSTIAARKSHSERLSQATDTKMKPYRSVSVLCKG